MSEHLEEPVTAPFRGQRPTLRGKSRVPSVSIDLNVLNFTLPGKAMWPKGLPATWPSGRPHARDPNLHEEGRPEGENGGHVASVIRARGVRGRSTLWLAASRVL